MPGHTTGPTADPDGWHATRRRGEQPWRSWCKSPTWKSIRRHRLSEEPECRQCAIEGRKVTASHVDHVEPHLGQWLLFFRYENTQSLCAHHHNMHRQREKRGQLIERSGIREPEADAANCDTRACQAWDDRGRESRVRAL